MNAFRTAPLLSTSLALALSLSLAGCHGSVVYYDPPPPPVFSEFEPNDDAFYANDFGYVSPGQHLCIAGNVRDDGFDPQDGFAFTAGGPVVVDFSLHAFCACADLDVWLYDPVRDEFVALFDSPYDPESGQFTVYSQDFHLVVVSAGGHSDYQLDVHVSAFYGALAGDGHVTAEALAPVGLQVAPVHAADLSRAPQAYLRTPARNAAPDVLELFRIDERTGDVESVLILRETGSDG
jgi:hypothetical protein